MQTGSWTWCQLNSADSSDRLQCWDRSSCEAELNCRRKSITSSFSSSSILVLDGWSFQYFVNWFNSISFLTEFVLYHCHISTLVALFVQELLILSAARESLSYSFVTRHNNQALFDVKSENNYSVLSAHRWQLGITWCTKTDGIYQSKGSVHLSQHFHFMTLRWKLRDQKHLVWWGHGLQWAVFLFLLFWDCNIDVGIPPP